MRVGRGCNISSPMMVNRQPAAVGLPNYGNSSERTPVKNNNFARDQAILKEKMKVFENNYHYQKKAETITLPQYEQQIYEE